MMGGGMMGGMMSGGMMEMMQMMMSGNVPAMPGAMMDDDMMDDEGIMEDEGMMGDDDAAAQPGMMMGPGTMGPAGLMVQPDASAEMPVSVEDALITAQRYLDAYLPGAEAAGTADAFYGYYTTQILRQGEVVGLLSVNGVTRQVAVHTWHDDFVEMSGVTAGN